MLQQPQGMLQQPQGMLQQPQGMLQKPQGMLQQPLGMHVMPPHGITQQPQGMNQKSPVVLPGLVLQQPLVPLKSNPVVQVNNFQKVSIFQNITDFLVQGKGQLISKQDCRAITSPK